METIENSSLVKSRFSRRSLLRVFGLSAAVTAASSALAGCGGGSSSGNSTSDQSILSAAATAEALAAVMYANLIQISPLYAVLGNTPNKAGQSFLVAAYEQEVAHYNLLVANGAVIVPTTQSFYFPAGTFTSVQTAYNTMETVEELQIAIYLYAVNNLSIGTNRTYAAQILGVESEHRVLGRVTANFQGLSGTSGLANQMESLGSGYAANNYEYERLFSNTITSITSITNILSEFTTVPSSSGTFSQQAYTVNTLLPNVAAGTLATLPNISSVNQDVTVVTNT